MYLKAEAETDHNLDEGDSPNELTQVRGSPSE